MTDENKIVFQSKSTLQSKILYNSKAVLIQTRTHDKYLTSCIQVSVLKTSEHSVAVDQNDEERRTRNGGCE